jgi:hypothetical protein
MTECMTVSNQMFWYTVYKLTEAMQLHIKLHMLYSYKVSNLSILNCYFLFIACLTVTIFKNQTTLNLFNLW